MSYADGLEPAVQRPKGSTAHDWLALETQAMVSIAISLKRIADALEHPGEPAVNSQVVELLSCIEMNLRSQK